MKAPLTILVAEDELTDAFFLRRALSRVGISVVLYLFEDGRRLIDHLQLQLNGDDAAVCPLPRLILLDVKMPRADGFDVLAWIRKEPRLAQVPVVMLSSWEQSQDKLRAQRMGADEYLVKPHSVEELNDLVSRFKIRWLAGDPHVERQAA